LSKGACRRELVEGSLSKGACRRELVEGSLSNKSHVIAGKPGQRSLLFRKNIKGFSWQSPNVEIASYLAMTENKELLISSAVVHAHEPYSRDSFIPPNDEQKPHRHCGKTKINYYHLNDCSMLLNESFRQVWLNTVWLKDFQKISNFKKHKLESSKNNRRNLLIK
jgi:hypothetical protein